MKTRILGLDLGSEGDNLYSSSSKIYYLKDYKVTKEVILGRYNTYRDLRSASRPVSYYNGRQVFDSTNFKPPRYNNLRNLKIQGTHYPYYHSRLYGGTRVAEVCYYREPMGGYDVLENLSTSWDGAGDAARRAWWTMQPRFEGDISMLNFLFELKDFRDILRYALKFNYKDLAFEFKNLLKYFRRVARDPTKPLAEAHLTKEFALKPLLSDIMTIHAQLGQTVRQVQNDFQSQGHELQKTHYSELLAVKDELTVNPSLSWFSTGKLTTNWFTATMEYTYNYTMRQEMDAFLRYWGLSGSFEAMWNAIPFSFLVDYFIKIGKSFHAMETDGNVDLVPHQYCESVLTTFTHGTHFNGSPKSYHYVVNGKYFDPRSIAHPVFVTGLRGTVYERRVTSPNRGLYIPRVSLPSFSQQKNMLALVRCFL